MVSVIVPCYNREALVGETLDSILAQSFTDWECILVDDGSTDSTVEVLTHYADQDTRFRAFVRPTDRPKSLGTVRNYGYENANGDLIQFFDSDDIMERHHLMKKVELLNAHPEYDFVVCRTTWFRGSTAVRRHGLERLPESNDLFEDWVCNRVRFLPNVPLWRRRCFSNLDRLFDEDLSFGEDTEFHTRALYHCRRYGVVDERLVRQRIHSRSMTANAMQRGQCSETRMDTFAAFRRQYDFTLSENAMSPRLLHYYMMCALFLFKTGLVLAKPALATDALRFAREVYGHRLSARIYLALFEVVSSVNRFFGERVAGFVGDILYIAGKHALSLLRSSREFLYRPAAK